MTEYTHKEYSTVLTEKKRSGRGEGEGRVGAGVCVMLVLLMTAVYKRAHRKVLAQSSANR
jgi:hypothetical protein